MYYSDLLYSYRLDQNTINANKEYGVIGGVNLVLHHFLSSVCINAKEKIKSVCSFQIQTTSQSSPTQAYTQAIDDLDKELDYLKKSFEVWRSILILFSCRVVYFVNS